MTIVLTGLTMGYADTFNQSIDDTAEFWLDKAGLIDWTTPPSCGSAEDVNGIERWYPDGVLNTCFNAIDRHVLAGRAEQVAIYYDSPVADDKSAITYAQLLEKVAGFAGGLRSLGVEKGDRVVIYMPMIPEAVIAMLACARLGAIHSVVFGGFVASELAARLADAAPKVIVTASCGIEVDRVIEYMPIVDEALAIVEQPPQSVIVFERPQSNYVVKRGRDTDWGDLIKQSEPAACVPVAATDPLYILYTSGTTGKPKGVVRDNG